MDRLTDEQWTRFHDDGYVIVRSFLGGSELRVLQSEIDNIMLGRAGAKYTKLMMELDAHDESEPAFSKGFKGATFDYKRIQHLEFVPVFRRYIQKPIFRDACNRIYGSKAVSVFRTMLVNKPPRRGARIGWHQDCWNYLDRNPVLTVWTALDPVTADSGCLQIVPGSHKHGHICPEDTSGFLTDAMIGKYCLDRDVVLLTMEKGDVVFLHNHLLHRSDVNVSEQHRRALSVCYMDASTQNVETRVTYPVVFGDSTLSQQHGPNDGADRL
jgi:phytanoyl-CoA hydroxylase